MSQGVFERRGYMLDVSRDRVPNRATLGWLVEILAGAGFNELQLYIEHTFTYTGHEPVWRDASPFSHDDLRWLDDVCRASGIDLVANNNGFGHMERWFVHDEYRSRAECPDGYKSVFGRGQSKPTCMAPTAGNAAFAVELARDMASAVRHPRIHIGGDEPFELGDGVSAPDVAERGRDRVYLDHLLRIMQPLIDDGHEVMFWGDLFRRDASLMADIPDGAIGVVWNYEAPSEISWMDHLPAELLDRLGLPDDANTGFAAHARLFIDSNTPFWVAPGTASWNTIIGRNRNASGNIADAVAVGSAHGATGLLLADWGDGGHWHPLPVSLPSIVRAGAAAQSGTMPSPNDVGTMIDELCGFDPGTGALIDKLGEISESVGVMSPNGSPLSSAMAEGGPPVLGQLDLDGVVAAHQQLVAAVVRFGTGTVGGPRGEIVAREMAAACGLALLGLRRLAEHDVDLGTHGAPTPQEVAAALEAQRDAWLLSSEPGGLDDSIAKLAG